ncbi:hypothetical protein CFM90_26400 (plasmid) [Ralstonia solanacearum]|nr:hypothetical protein CFM90_26400 [Ralstonia solanacearum]
MLRRILRALDLSFVLSQRARAAVMDARLRGVPAGVMYDGGLDVKADDIAPPLRQGVPPIRWEARQYVLCRVDNEFGHVTIHLRRPAYRAESDSWFFREEGSSRQRTPDDLWLTAEEYEDIFCAAAIRAASRH